MTLPKCSCDVLYTQWDSENCFRIAFCPLHEAAPDLLEALKDMVSGWRYIRQQHGDLPGVGWNRAEKNAIAAIFKATGVE